MNIDDLNALPLGLYRIFWKSGGSSLASVGMNSAGKRWVAPTNWIEPATFDELNAKGFGDIASVEELYHHGSRPPAPASADLDQAATSHADKALQHSNVLYPQRVAVEAFKAGAAWARGQDTPALQSGDHLFSSRELRKRRHQLDECHKQSVSDTSAHSDPYLRGFSNGVILGHAIMHGIEPDYIEPTKNEVDKARRVHHEPGEFGEGATVIGWDLGKPGSDHSAVWISRLFKPGEPVRVGSPGPSDPLDALKMEDLEACNNPAPSLRDVMNAIADVRNMAEEAGLSFAFTLSSEFE